MFYIFFSVIEQFFLYMPLMLGAYISISLMKIPHLAIDMTFVCGAACAAKILTLINNQNSLLSLLLVIITSIISGALVGAINSLLHTVGKLPHLIANITTTGLFYGISLFLLQGPYMPIYNNPLSLVPMKSHPEIFTIILINIFLLILVILFINSQIGYSCTIYGMNQSFFNFYNQSSTYIVTIGLIISSALAAVSGYFVSQTSGFVDINAGQGVALFCITSLIIGKSVIKTKKQFSLLFPCFGIFIYCLLQQLLLYIGFNGKYFPFIQAVIIANLLILQYRKCKTKSVDLFMGV